jgi:putative redox protein
MSAHSHHEPIVVTHDGGMRFAAQVRSHRVMVDQPQGAGGLDSAPMPIELLGVSLGTCIALYVQQFLQSRGLPSEGMRVEVDQHGARHPNRVGEFVVRVVLPEPLPPAYAELLERVAASCPAHHTLAHGSEVRIVIETPAPVA